MSRDPNHVLPAGLTGPGARKRAGATTTWEGQPSCSPLDFFVVVVVYFILSRQLYLAFSANLGLLCMPHPGMGPLV